MDEIIYSLLDSAGWYKNRSINIDYEIESLKREGFTQPNEQIIKLLKEFWNLKIEFTLPNGDFSDIVLNIETVLNNTDEEAISIYERMVNEKLIPVGVLHFNTATILVSLNLTFYIVTEDDIYKVAESFDSFLDVTINRKAIYKFSK